MPVTPTAPLTPRAATDALLASRAEDATLCPSEVARTVARSRDGTDRHWRDEMPEVHAAIDDLVAEGVVSLSWKGHPLATRDGPYRIHRRREDS